MLDLSGTEEAETDHQLVATRGAAPLVATPPATDCAVSVVIPARDEAESIERTLTALVQQVDLAGRPLSRATYEMILLTNNCRDATAAVARRLARISSDVAVHVAEIDLPEGLAHVGTARRLGMDEACRRLLAVGRPDGIIATTDADTRVAPTWIAAITREHHRGAVAIGGRVLLDARERQAMAPSVRSRFLRNVGYGALANEVEANIDPRPGDPWPCHEQFCGASLAITARAYHDVGGLPLLPSGEDAALSRALRRADIEIRHSLDVRVHTSGRMDGRAPAGLAVSLATWATEPVDEPYKQVPGCPALVARATWRRRLREHWRRIQFEGAGRADEAAPLARLIGVTEPWLRVQVRQAATFGSLLDEVETVAAWPKPEDLVDIRAAINQLRMWLAVHPRSARSALAQPLASFKEVQAVSRFAQPL